MEGQRSEGFGNKKTQNSRTYIETCALIIQQFVEMNEFD